MDREAASFLEVEISKLVSFKPLYGTVFLYLKKMQVANVPTMGVGPHNQVSLALFYNPEFVKSLTSMQLRAVLQHEALHVLLLHIFRAQHFNYKHSLFNIAADLAINCNLEGLPDWVYYPEKVDLKNYESAEWYYDEISKNEKLLKELEKNGSLLDDHSFWEECDDELLKDKARSINQRAIKAQEEKGWGNIPGELRQAVVAANKPVVNWKRELRYFINRLVLKGRKSTRTKPNRRYGYDQPGTKRGYTSRLLVAIDTSGSVSEQELEEFLREINGMISHVQCEVVCFDTRLYGKPRSFTRRIANFEIEGRGGTNFGPPIQYAVENNYNGIILLTDGFAPFPEKPLRTRVMWALSNSGAKVEPPYGKKIVIKEGQR